MLQAQHISRSFGIHVVLNDVSLVINKGDRVGIVGANGAGKSVLLKILAGLAPPDAGMVSYAPGVEVGYLPQATPAFSGQTIDDLILESIGDLRQLEARMRQLELSMGMAEGDELASVIDEYGEVASRFQERGGYDLDHRIDIVMAGLNLAQLPRTRDVHSLSGGEKARIGLAILLLRSPDLLLLDEPTNHLDAASLEWLETYLGEYDGAVVLVSHDRQLLNRTVQRIVELDEHDHRLKKFEGNYDAYQQAKAAERQRWNEEYERYREKLKELKEYIRETAWRVGHNRARRDNEKMAFTFRGEKAQQAISRNIRTAEEQLKRLRETPIPKPPEILRIDPRFESDPFEASVAVNVVNLSKSFAGRTALDNVTFMFRSDSHVVIVGPNGAGKSTLLNIIVGRERPDSGEVQIAGSARIGYLPQEPTFPDLPLTVLETYKEGLTGYDEQFISDLLRYGLFHYDDLRKTVGALSLGQRRKLEIARLIACRPNMLLLDEPTNHISLDVLDAFEAAVAAFPGPVVVVSHDRWFIQRFGGEVWELRNGKLNKFASVEH